MNGSYSATIALSCEEGYQASGTLYLPGNEDDILPENVTVTVESNSTVVVKSNLSPRFCDYYREKNYTSTLVQMKVFGIMEDVTNVTSVLTPTGGDPQHPAELENSQTTNPPQLLIDKFEIDWCQYEKAELTWTFSNV